MGKIPSGVKLPKALSEGEETFAFQMKVRGLRPEREYVFYVGRKWRFDFAFPDSVIFMPGLSLPVFRPLAIEIEGGSRSNGRHNRASGYTAGPRKIQHRWPPRVAAPPLYDRDGQGRRCRQRSGRADGGSMTRSTSPRIGIDHAKASSDASVMFVPHPGRSGCGYTVVTDESLRLFRLGLFPLRCKSCGELMTDKEGA